MRPAQRRLWRRWVVVGRTVPAGRTADGTRRPLGAFGTLGAAAVPHLQTCRMSYICKTTAAGSPLGRRLFLDEGARQGMLRPSLRSAPHAVYMAHRKRAPVSALPTSPPHADGSLKPRSRWWFVASPFGWGILIFLALRFDDRRRAKQCLWIAILSFPLYYLIVIPIVAVASAVATSPPW